MNRRGLLASVFGLVATLVAPKPHPLTSRATVRHLRDSRVDIRPLLSSSILEMERRMATTGLKLQRNTSTGELEFTWNREAKPHG